MPLYEYECGACQQTVEVLVRTQNDKPNCPTCGAEGLEKVFSVPASPAVRGGGLPVTSSQSESASCAAPRCCGGGCQF